VNFCFDGEALATIIQVTTLALAREKVRKMFEAYRPGASGNGNRDRDRDAVIAESVREKFANYRAGGQ